ncbi:hypothetical protein MMC30_007816 [Trapelia coarctata]|nr:hypothetical protein [Trapelia coarctata]
MSAPTNSTGVPQGNPNDYIGGQLLATCIVFIVLDILFVCLRICSRRLADTKLGWDDYLIPPALIMNLAISIIGIISVKIAYTGWHFDAAAKADADHDSDIIPIVLKITFALEWIYPTAVLLPKLSIVCLYLRIFTSKFAQVSSYTLLVVLISTWISFVVAATVQCFPIAYAWDKSLKGQCFNQTAFYSASNVPNTVTDLAMLLLPMPTIWGLQISKFRKLGLTMIFVTGSIGIIGSCVRIYSLNEVKTFSDPGDITWNGTSLTIWTVTEPSMYLIAACLISLRPLLLHLTRRARMHRYFNPSSHVHSPDSSKPKNIYGDFKGPRRSGSDPDSITQFVSQVRHSNCAPSDERLERGAVGMELREISVRTDIEVEFMAAKFSNLV